MRGTWPTKARKSRRAAWGYRHQFNIADSGLGSRGPRVHNDRAGEVGRTLNAKDFDLERIFGEEGAQIVHLSGLIAALSPDASLLPRGRPCCEEARHPRLVRPQLPGVVLGGREKELRDVFAEIASLSDILIGNEEDFQLASAPRARRPEATRWPRRSTDSRR